jgi:phage/plasmid-like protein (TIGR03299 family)
MSQESSLWLNTKTLIGFVLKRGKAWHYRQEHQGKESNHYDEAIPVADVTRRLFNFTVVEAPLYIPDGHGGFAPVPKRKAMVTSDTNEVLGVFSGDAGTNKGYHGHDYSEWLLEGPANLIDMSKGELGIGSAGLLKNRAVAWVSIEVPENIVTPEGVEFRPNLLATTSFDGSIATTYKRCVQNVVCDNTLAAGLSEQGQVFKVKHTAGSSLKLAEARSALSIIFEVAEEFAAEVKRLSAWKVTTRAWNNVLDALVPVPEIPAGQLSTRGYTLAVNKREELTKLYNNDERVTPWKGTALGVLQAFNTYEHHIANRRGGAHRAQVNMLRAVDGTTAQADANVIKTLALVSN